MAEVLTVGLLTDSRSPGGGQLGCLRTNEPLTLSHVPWRLTCHPNVDMHPVLCCLGLRHPEKADGWAHAAGIDDGSTVRVGVPLLGHIPQGACPECSDPMRVLRIATERPMCRHAGTLPPAPPSADRSTSRAQSGQALPSWAGSPIGHRCGGYFGVLRVAGQLQRRRE